MHFVDLGKSFQTHIYLQNFVSIQPLERALYKVCRGALLLDASQEKGAAEYHLARAARSGLRLRIGNIRHTHVNVVVDFRC